MGNIKREIVKVTTTGSAGSATGSASTSLPIVGKILRIAVNYHASAPATTDTTISHTVNGVATNIVTRTNVNTDFVTYPVALREEADGTDAAAGDNLWTEPVVFEKVSVALAQCDALTDAAVVEIVYEGVG